MPAIHKHPEFIVRSAEPFNGGPPLPLLREHVVTPSELFFVRNHGNVPDVDVASYRLRVEGVVDRELQLSLAELRNEFPSVTLPATLQCAGIRRTELMAVEPIPGELPWEAEAISHGVWRGVPLHAVLAAAGVDSTAKHVAFSGLDVVQRRGETFGFGGSIPLAKALSPELMLAYELNGAPLPPTHGFPLRVLAPGYVGARSVKWLATITLQAEPSANYFQQRAYKLFPPDVHANTVDWAEGEMLGELDVNAVICQPTADATLSRGTIDIQGYAIAGGPQGIERVEVSSDGGTTWTEARLSAPLQPWSWRFWSAQVALSAGRHQLVVRACAMDGATQPPVAGPIWNFKGYMNNAWHRITIVVS